jgi:transcriptional regulator with XRE-family HTH domain
MTKPKETLGQRIQRLREKQGLSASELARRVDVTPTAVWNWENDNTQPRYLTLIRIAEVLGVSADFLETGSEIDSVDLLKETPPEKAMPKDTQVDGLTNLHDMLQAVARLISKNTGIALDRIKVSVQLTP